MQIIKARVMNRVGTEAEWLVTNPVILKGEIALVIIGAFIKFKIGDGVKTFSQLTYNVFDPTNLKGKATPATDPGDPISPELWVGQTGVYPNFGGLEITAPAGFLIWDGEAWSVIQFNIDFTGYLKLKNVLTMGAVNGSIIIDIDVNGTVRTVSPGASWVQIGAEFLPIANPTTEPISGANGAGLNWLYYFRSTQKVRLFNYTSGELPINPDDAVLLGYMFDCNVNNLATISESNIKVAGFFKNKVGGALSFKSRCLIDKVNHKIILSDSYYQSTRASYVDLKASDYATGGNPNPFTFSYDPGLLLQSIIFDPTLLDQGLNPFFITGVGYNIGSPQQILIASIISNNITTNYNFDEISTETLLTAKLFQGQKIRSIGGSGTVDIKSNGDIAVSGGMYSMNEDGNFTGVFTGTTPLKAGSNLDGLNWIVYNKINAKIYLVNYTAGGIDREVEDVIGYMFNIDAGNLFTLSKISVNGHYHGDPVTDNPTGELLLPKKIFLENGRNLPIYKTSVMRNRIENQNDLVVIKNGADENDFNVSRDYIFGSYLLSPFVISSSGNYLAFCSVNKVNGDTDYINNVQIIKKAATTQTVKGQQIGDSLTNRGVSKYIANYLLGLATATITYNTFGTLDNSGKQGEGREGWTYSNFIGRDNYHDFSGVVIVPGNANMNQNPFLKLANSTDKANHPDWCFRNTGAQDELSYTTDPVKTGDFYIFDYAYYMGVNSIPSDLQVITIALSTNDFSINGSEAVERCALGLTVMLTQIRAALPNVKIGVIPTPVYGSSNDGVGRFSAAADWINRSQVVINPFSDVDIIGVWAHMSSVFDFPYNDLGFITAGNNTKKLQKSDIIHFDMQGYLQYAPVVANWIINVV